MTLSSASRPTSTSTHIPPLRFFLRVRRVVEEVKDKEGSAKWFHRERRRRWSGGCGDRFERVGSGRKGSARAKDSPAASALAKDEEAWRKPSVSLN